jgi:hypothetical protein
VRRPDRFACLIESHVLVFIYPIGSPLRCAAASQASVGSADCRPRLGGAVSNRLAVPAIHQQRQYEQALNGSSSRALRVRLAKAMRLCSRLNHSVVQQKKSSKMALAVNGSQRLLQLAVNHRPELLLSALRKCGAMGRRESLRWVSPLLAENHCEYRDSAVLEKLGVTQLIRKPLTEFWPARGCVWDALGVAAESRPILVEAKAHIPEAATPGTRASEKSRALIESSLAQARRYFAPRSKAEWSGLFYQYANRLAYQFYFRSLNGVESSLVFLYFTNAVDMDGPATEEEWHGASRLIHAVLGLPADLSSFGVYHAFVDARQLADAAA